MTSVGSSERDARTRLQAQAARFVLAGGIVAAFYVGCTALLSKTGALPFQLALGLGFAAALCLHFLLQRFFVWAHTAGFALAFHHQLGRYLAIAGLQYLVTAAATATLPRPLGVSVFVVYIVTTALVTISNFLIFRARVFHRGAPTGGELA
jgi:putative flippase GtrA